MIWSLDVHINIIKTLKLMITELIICLECCQFNVELIELTHHFIRNNRDKENLRKNETFFKWENKRLTKNMCAK